MHKTPTIIQNLLSQWECLAFMAYDYYVRFGRIILGISLDNEDSEHPLFMAILCNEETMKTDPSLSFMISSFDPDREILIQFEDISGRLRTQRLRTKLNSFTPRSVYAREIMDRYEQNPCSVNLDLLPSWLRNALTAHPPVRFN